MLIWYLIETGKLPHLEEILPKVREHLLYRLSHHKGTLTMTSIPYIPITNVPLGVSCWFPLNAIEATNDQQYSLDLLKTIYPFFSILIKVNELQGLPIQQETFSFIRKALAFIYITNVAKKEITGALDNVVQLGYKCVHVNIDNIRTKQFKNFPLFIPIDSELPSGEERNAILAKLPEIFSLLTPDECRAASQVALIKEVTKMSLDQMFINYPESSWIYGLKHFNIPEVKICPLTLRPFTHVGPLKIKWSIKSENIFGNIDEQIHIHNMFIKHVQKYKVIPTQDDLLIHAYNYHILHKKKPTLPNQILDFIKCACDGYKAAFAENERAEKQNIFRKIVHNSSAYNKRLEMENKYKVQQENKRNNI